MGQRAGEPMTPAELAACASTNPVVIRRTFAGLRERGVGYFSCSPGEATLGTRSRPHEGEAMTIKEKVIQVVEGLPADATLDQIVSTLHDLEAEDSVEPQSGTDAPLPAGGVWDLLEGAAGTVEMPADWASEHDHYLYGTPKRSSAA
jgi:hypothetical protein